MHIVPRFKDERFPIDCGLAYGLMPDRKKLEQIASTI